MAVRRKTVPAKAPESSPSERPRDDERPDVLWISGDRVERHSTEDLASLLRREEGYVWLDVPVCRDEEAQQLLDVFGFHKIAVGDCQEPGHVPKIHAYKDHVFVVLHAPEMLPGGVRLIELDQFIARNFLVTVHEPLPGLSWETALRETAAVKDRLEAGRLRPETPYELSYSIVSALGRRVEACVWDLATRIAAMEQLVIHGQPKDPEAMLEDLFKLRHELLTIAMLSAQNREMYERMTAVAKFLPPGAHEYMNDIVDQFDAVHHLCEGQKEFLQGVVDFYQSRTTTKMNVAMERLALIAAIVLPISAIASVYGMNIIVSDQTRPEHLAGVLAALLLMCAVMLRWTKTHGWW